MSKNTDATMVGIGPEAGIPTLHRGEEVLRDPDKHKSQRAPDLDRTENDTPPEDLSEVMDFSSYDLNTTIRLIVLSGESRRIDVRRGSRSGSIYIKAGEIYRAVTSERSGDEAFFEIISWDRAIHKDTQQVDPLEGNVRVPTNVLLQAMKNQVYRKEP